MSEKMNQILIVDDSKSMRMMIEAILSNCEPSLNAHFSMAIDGKQAYEMIQQTQYDVIIIDIHMPRMTGLEFCQQARQQLGYANLPIFLMTMKNDYDTVETCFAHGATDFIGKPINEVELSSRVMRILNQRQIEKALYLAQKSAETANLNKSRFLAAVNHELKSPLNAISGFCQLLENSVQGTTERDMLKVLHEASEHMTNMIEQLLEYEQYETDKCNLTIEPVYLHQTIAKQFTLMAIKINDKQLTVHNNVDRSLIINADKRLFTSLVNNLISNAIKYNHPNGTINIDTENTPQGLTLHITDTGIGMTASQVEGIYEPFIRYNQNIEGHGLGMSICSTIAKRLNLTLTITSEIDIGTSISIRFPLD